MLPISNAQPKPTGLVPPGAKWGCTREDDAAGSSMVTPNKNSMNRPRWHLRHQACLGRLTKTSTRTPSSQLSASGFSKVFWSDGRDGQSRQVYPDQGPTDDVEATLRLDRVRQGAGRLDHANPALALKVQLLT